MNYIKLQLNILSLEEKQQANGLSLNDDELNHAPVLDGVIPRNREVNRFMHLFNLEYLNGRLKDDSHEFYSLSAEQFEHLQALSRQAFGVTPKQVIYRGNTFTADIYLKSFPFIEVKQLFIGIKQ